MGFGTISFDGSTNNDTSNGSPDLPSLITKFGLDPSNTIMGARNIPKLTLSPLSASVNPSKAAKSSLATIKSNAWADQGNSGLAGFWDTVKNAGESALAFLDRGHQGVLNTWNDVLTGQPQNILSDIGGSLSGSKTGMTFGNILDDLGWHQNTNGGFLGNVANGLRDTVGFAGDIATDPLTYLTFGEGSVAKAGLQALKPFTEAGELAAKAAGKTKGTAEFQQIVDHFTNSPRALDALNSALAENSKSLINFNIPFGKQATLINKPSFMQKQTMKINPVLADQFGLQMGAKGIAPSNGYSLVSHILGKPVQDLKGLNTQEYDYLNKVWNDHLAGQADLHFGANSTTPDPIQALKNHFDTLVSNPDTLLPYKEYQGRTGFSPLTQRLIMGKNGDKLTALGKAQANFGQLFGSKRFTALGTQMGNHLTAQGVRHVVTAHNKAFAYSKDAMNELKQISKTPEFKSLSPDEWKEVAYSIEGQKPTYTGYTPLTANRQAVVDHVAQQVKDFRDNWLNPKEQAAGLNYQQLANPDKYFPHIYNVESKNDWDGIMADLQNMGAKGQRIMASIKNSTGGYQKSRKSFATMADLEDYRHDPNALNADKFANTIHHPLEAFGHRAISGMNDVANQEAINNIIREGTANKLKRAGAGWTVVGKEIPQLAGHVVPDEVYKLLSTGHQLLTNDKALNGFMNNADKVMSMLRRNYTVTRVGFHARQLAGHVFHNLLAGISPASYAKGLKFMTQYAKNPHDPAVQAWLKELLGQGILHTGESSADLLHNINSDLKSSINMPNLGTKEGWKTIGKNANPFHNQFILGTAGRKLGTGMDNISRVAHYMQRRTEGMSPEQAADSVRKYLFNYGEINQAGRNWRLLIPFYQWMRNNLPLQLASLVKQPMAYNTVQNFLNEFQGQPDPAAEMQKLGIGGMLNQQVINKLIEENHGILPKYIQDNYVKLPWTDHQGNDVYYNLALPSQDVKSAISNPLNFFTSAMNPLLQAMFEVHNNASNLNGAPIDKFTPKGESVAMTPAGLEYLANSLFGSSAQMFTGAFNGVTNNDWSNLQKAFGVNTANINNSNAINDLLYTKSNELKTRASAIKKAVTKQVYPNGYQGGQ